MVLPMYHAEGNTAMVLWMSLCLVVNGVGNLHYD